MIPIPFSLSHMRSLDLSIRDRVLNRCVVGIRGIRLTELSELLSADPVQIHLMGITLSPPSLENRCIPIALSKTADVRSQKLVLGVSALLAAKLIDAALGRPQRPTSDLSVASLSQGEIGALLFALDRAGKDWITAGGDKFVIRGLLEDTDQIADYLGQRPEVEIQARLQMEAQRFLLCLWCNAPESDKVTSARRSVEPAYAWNVRIGLSAGWSSLTLGEVSTVAVGDKIVLDAWNHPQGRGGLVAPLLWNGNWHRFGRFIDRGEIEVISEPGPEDEMDRTKQSESSKLSWTLTDMDESDVTEMAVIVRVEVGSLKMPVEQALGLVPGRILRLDRPLGPEVNVFVGDKLLGRGTMVDADGFMAVEITELR